MVTVTCVLFIVFIILYPKEIIYSVKEGLLLWYNSVLPSIFPFLTASNILIYIGAVAKLGKMLTPITKPLFNIPGSGAFALLMGGISGYPIGAKITADLRNAGKLSQYEAQRLICFCNNAGPLFVIGAVGTSILGSAKAGYFLLITNYIAALIIGVIFRFYKMKEAPAKYRFIYGTSGGSPLTFGKALAHSVTSATESILQIGGFILIFSVVIAIARLSGILFLFSEALRPLFVYFNIDTTFCPGFAAGIIEMTNGVKMIGDAGGDISAFFKQKVILSGILVSFGGLSIYSQTASFISKTDIKPGIYFAAKIMQCIIQTIIAVFAFDLIFM